MGESRQRSEDQKGRIGSDDFSFAGETVIHSGSVVTFLNVGIRDGSGVEHQRDVVRHPGSVSVVAYQDGWVYLVQQYRAPVNADLIELPAGKRDVSGEAPEVTAVRELEEEIGKRPGSVELLCNMHHSPGFCDEYGFIFLATDLTDVPLRREGPEEQVMSVHKVLLSDAVQMCLDGRITDAKTMVGLLAAANKLAA